MTGPPNLVFYQFGFILSNFLFIIVIYNRFEHPLHFSLIAGGLILFSYLLNRHINKVVSRL